MSRSSIVRIVPVPPPCRGGASDLRYRLLMAALGSNEETNPLLSDDAGAHEAPDATTAAGNTQRFAD
jgi:hypothetical protein